MYSAFIVINKNAPILTLYSAIIRQRDFYITICKTTFFYMIKGRDSAMETKFNFIKKKLEALPIPEKGYKTYSDTTEKGLKIYVTSKGTKTFFVRKMVNNRDERIIIGDFPTLSIENARSKAQAIKLQIIDNINPNEEKSKIRKEITLGELFNQFMERYSKKLKKSWQYDEREIPKFLGMWFNRRISDITKMQIQKLHEDIGEKNGLYQANRTLERLKSMYNRAIEWGWDGINPCNGIKKNKEEKRDRFIHPEEFQRFFEALYNEPSEVARNYILMSLFTGARKANVLAMRWDEIDFILGIWRIPDTKNGEPVNLPLVNAAIELLNCIERKNEWVFPSPILKNNHLQDPKKAWKRILTEAGISNLRIHDIRRTLGSYQAIMGTSLNIIGKSLGHKSQASTQIYARLTTDPVRKSMEDATNKMLEYGTTKDIERL